MESLKIAAMADVYEMNVAPHNFYGHLSSVISAHFCAAVPNFRIMETDIDAVPWRDELVDHAAGHRERRVRAADAAGLGRRGQRGRGAGATAEKLERCQAGTGTRCSFTPITTEL